MVRPNKIKFMGPSHFVEWPFAYLNCKIQINGVLMTFHIFIANGHDLGPPAHGAKKNMNILVYTVELSHHPPPPPPPLFNF